uniref:Uncharacterized protein n=1 Tax=Arundo donax TaxID=35708 RepID=A0A0A9B851_ARUDO
MPPLLISQREIRTRFTHEKRLNPNLEQSGGLAGHRRSMRRRGRI